jgi:hypothetical protein
MDLVVIGSVCWLITWYGSLFRDPNRVYIRYARVLSKIADHLLINSDMAGCPARTSTRTFFQSSDERIFTRLYYLRPILIVTLTFSL